MLLSDSPVEWQTVTEEKIHGREREDRAGMARCNVQLTRWILRARVLKHYTQQSTLFDEAGTQAQRGSSRLQPIPSTLEEEPRNSVGVRRPKEVVDSKRKRI